VKIQEKQPEKYSALMETRGKIKALRAKLSEQISREDPLERAAGILRGEPSEEPWSPDWLRAEIRALKALEVKQFQELRELIQQEIGECQKKESA